MASKSGMVELQIVGVRVELPSNQPIILLREQDGNRYLPIWIGVNEASAIAIALEGAVPPRPLTHDLLRSVIDAVGALATRVVITEMRDSVFYADLELDVAGETVKISARPSDAIALAVRTGTPLLALAEVLDEAAVQIEDGDEEDKIAEFREFLEGATAEDFLRSEGPEHPE